MKHLLLLLLIPAIIAIGGCSTADSPTSPGIAKDAVAIKRPYNNGRGGLQITAIYYDQNQNRDSLGIYDEWIVLESDHPLRTAGWQLDADDSGQRYNLPDSIHQRLRIYTRQGPGEISDSTLALGLKVWIWNNTDPDVAKIFNDSGVVVDSLTYKP